MTPYAGVQVSRRRLDIMLITAIGGIIVLTRAWAELSPGGATPLTLGFPAVFISILLLAIGALVGLGTPLQPASRVCSHVSALLAIWLMNCHFLWVEPSSGPWAIIDWINGLRWFYAPWLISLAAHLALIFPTVDPWYRKYSRPVLAVVYGQGFFYLYDDAARTLGHPMRLVGETAEATGLLLLLTVGVRLIYRSRQLAAADQRTRMTVIGAGMGIAAFAIGGLILVPVQIVGIAPPLGPVPLLTLAFFPLSIAFAILRLHVLSSDRALRRLLVRLIVGISIGALLLSIVVAIAATALPKVHSLQAPLALIAIGLLLAAVLPLEVRAFDALERYWDQARQRDRTALARFSHVIPAISSADTLARLVATELPRSLEIASAHLWIRSPLLYLSRGTEREKPGGIAGGASLLATDRAVPHSLRLREESEIFVRSRLFRHPLLRRDQDGGPDLADLPAAEQTLLEQLEVAAIVPIGKAEEELAGLLLVGPRTGGTIFDSDDLAALRTVAAQMATALENGRLLAAERRISAHRQAILAGIATGVVVIDPDGTVATINRAAGELLAIEESLPRRHFGQISALTPFATALRKVMEGASRYDGRATVPAPAMPHCRRILAYRVEPIVPTPTAPWIGLQLLLDDVTEALQIEREAEIQGRIEALGKYATTLMAEVRASAAAITDGVSRLHAQLPAESRIAEEVTEIQRALERIDDAIVAPLEEMAGTPAHLERIHLATLIRNLLAATPMTGIEIVLEPWDDTLYLQGASRSLDRALSNLLGNARQAMGSSGVLRIGLHATPEDEIVLDFADSGPGIPPRLQPHVFDRFKTTKEKGHGLGLAVARQLIQAHGGTIVLASSTAETGSCFVLTFPTRAGADCR
jgi:signal transduction histidine kinase